MAGLVAAELRGCGLEVAEDDSAAATGSDSGNLLARIPGPPGAPTVLLCAHLDTVPLTAPVEVVREDGRFANRNDGILGADNKAAVASCSRSPAARASGPRPRELGAPAGPPVGIELLFTTCEEIALLGAKELTHELRADFGFVFDHATPLGELIVAAPQLLPRRRPRPWRRRPRRHPSRGRPQRDRGRGRGDRLDVARPARRRDHRQRRHDRGRNGDQRRRRALPRRARGAQPRRREGRRGGQRRSSTRFTEAGRRPRVRRRDRPSSSSSAPTGCPQSPAGRGRHRRAGGARHRAAPRSRQAAAATPTSSSPTASRSSTSPTAPSATTSPTSRSPSPRSRACWTSPSASSSAPPGTASSLGP